MHKLLFFKEKICKLKKIGISIQVNNRIYQYSLYEEYEYFIKYVEQDVLIRYDSDNMECIYVYPINSFLSILKLHLHQKFPLAYVNQTEDDRAYIRRFGSRKNAFKKTLLKLCSNSKETIIDDNYTSLEAMTEKCKEKATVKTVNKDITQIKEKGNDSLQNIGDLYPRLKSSNIFTIKGSNKLIDD